MAAFFERLLAEDDPTRFAAMAEPLPEPPSFDSDEPYVASAAAVAVAEPVVETPEPAETVAETEAVADEVSRRRRADRLGVADPEAAPEAVAEIETPVAEEPDWPSSEPGLSQPAAATDGDDLFSIGADAPAAAEDPRVGALGLTPDFAAAEAEAATFNADDDGSDDESVPAIADDTIAARLAGLVPEGGATSESTTSTRLTVVGLVSVASIAGFKRHLSRATGVQHVGVSSGPDGEFVFPVTHDASVSLRDVVPALPGFAARVTDESDDGLTVTAQDPEAAN